MTNDVAIFLDLDNLVIGAQKANLAVDLHLLVEKVQTETNGRIVLLRAYGDNRQGQAYLKTMTEIGFDFQPVVRMNNFSKNLADMKIVVEAMETLLDGHNFQTYVFVTGDRDFTPMVQTLRKRGKYVIGIGVKHTTSQNLLSQCDQYIFYEDFLPTPVLTELDIEDLLVLALDKLLENEDTKVRASVLKQHMDELSRGGFVDSPYGNGSFRKFLERYPKHVSVVQDGTTTFVSRPSSTDDIPEVTPTPDQENGRQLHQRYRSELKKKRLRIVPATQRLKILKDILKLCYKSPSVRWKEITEKLSIQYKNENVEISKNLINDTLLIARKSGVVVTQKSKSLSSATLQVNLTKENPWKEAVILCDKAYLAEIIELPELFDIDEASLALYESTQKNQYLKAIIKKYNLNGNSSSS